MPSRTGAPKRTPGTGAIRQSVTIPEPVAKEVRRFAKERHLTMGRALVALAAGIVYALALALVAALSEPLSERDAAPGAVRAPQMAVHIPVTCARPEACGIVRAGS
jgi:hypothetical protein